MQCEISDQTKKYYANICGNWCFLWQWVLPIWGNISCKLFSNSKANASDLLEKIRVSSVLHT